MSLWRKPLQLWSKIMGLGKTVSRDLIWKHQCSGQDSSAGASAHQQVAGARSRASCSQALQDAREVFQVAPSPSQTFTPKKDFQIIRIIKAKETKKPSVIEVSLKNVFSPSRKKNVIYYICEDCYKPADSPSLMPLRTPAHSNKRAAVAADHYPR